MPCVFPIKLSGNLGERHRQLNYLVDEAYKNGEFQAIKDMPEQTPIDRLFKIDLAAKYKDVDYALATLKDEDMLFVSRALKTTWLLEPEFGNIINPSYLEEKLYPEMTTTAVNKTKHWIYINLHESKRCEEFYQYYSDDFNTAIKFLGNCSNELILREIFDILYKLTPHHLKVLSEKCPEVAKIYFDNLESNEKLLSIYSKKKQKFYGSLKGILKLNADIYLDITEKYFNESYFRKLSFDATKYIMTNQKSRFNNKPELYAAWLLDMKALTECLNEDEIKELVIKLARAKYLDSWFCYQAVEPLLKGLSIEERATFKHQVFVDKSVGATIEKWPYETPSTPEIAYPKRNIFQDKEHDPSEYTDLDPLDFRCGVLLKRKKKCLKRSGGGWKNCGITMRSVRKSSLDQLFDRYRFASFKDTLSELKRKITVENLKNRQNMMLVLVSKTGGHPETVEELLKLLVTRHENEPVNLRSTIIRSLVKRCCAWRLPQNIWNLFLKFGKDLGLDGKPTTADCKEGLHAVVLRNILEDKHDATVWNVFLEDYTNFSEYSLNNAEREVLTKRLPALLLTNTGEFDQTMERLHHVLGILIKYNISVEQCTGFIDTVKYVASNLDAKSLLYRIFNTKKARKELFRENFAVMTDDASYLNALKHDISVLESVTAFEKLIESEEIDHDRFIRKLALYFSEENGLTEKYLSILEKHVEESPQNLARPIVILGGIKLVPMLQKLDSLPKKSPQKLLASALRSNAHMARPLIDMDNAGWKLMGPKAVATRVITCSAINIDQNLQKLVPWRQTAKLAFVLSMRVRKEHYVLATIGERRRKFALHTALSHLRKRPLDLRVWDIILPLIEKLDPTESKLDKSLYNVDVVPSSVKLDYCVKVFEFFSKKVSKVSVLPMLCHMDLMLPQIDEEFMERVLVHFIKEDLTTENISGIGKMHFKGVSLYICVIAKFLLLSKSETEQQHRMKNIGEPFLKGIGDILKSSKANSSLYEYLDDFLQSLKYNKVYLDTSYVSCLPVFERIIKWMQHFLPLDIYFSKYANLHLTMLYFKSIRQSIKNNPAIFEDLPNYIEDCVIVVGHIFGKYIAHETTELMAKYFESVKEIYKTDVVIYLNKNFECVETKKLFVESIIKGILECESPSHLVAEHIAVNIDRCSEEMFKSLNECETPDVRFFLYADLKGVMC